MTDTKVKTSFIDNIEDAYYTTTLFAYIVLLFIIIEVVKMAKMDTVETIMYYILFIGSVTILTGAYFKRQGEIEQNLNEPLKLSWVSISLMVYIVIYLFSRTIKYKNESLLDYFFDFVGNDALTLFLLMIPVVVLVTILFFKRRNDELELTNSIDGPTKYDFIIKLIFGALTFILPIFLIYIMLFVSEFEKDFPYTAIILTIILGFIVVGVLLVLFKITKKTLFPGDKINTGLNKFTIFNFIKYLFLYVPCLVADFIDYLKYEYSITTKSSIFTLLATGGIIFSYFILPRLQNYLYNFGSVQLLNEPVRINKFMKLGSLQNLKSYNDYEEETPGSRGINLFNYNFKFYFEDNNSVDIFPSDEDTDKNAVINIDNKEINMYSYKYAITFWVYINPQPPNTGSQYNDYVSIFNFGNKPEILYKASNNHLLIKMLQAKDGDDIIYKSKDSSEFKLQKWNHFCINYDKGTLDVFLNNELIVSKPELVPYVSTNVISSGSDDGIQGGICNVRYYNKVLTKSQIYSDYESFKNKNPPTI